LCVAALASGEGGKIWMGCDNHPITKAELMQALYDSQKYGAFPPRDAQFNNDSDCAPCTREGGPDPPLRKNGSAHAADELRLGQPRWEVQSHGLPRRADAERGTEGGGCGVLVGAGDGRVVFTATDGALGRRMNNDVTRAALGWQPKYSSWADFMRMYAAGEVQEADTPEGRPHQ
jgi:hypothetical protein